MVAINIVLHEQERKQWLMNAKYYRTWTGKVSLSVLREVQMMGTFSIERNYFSFYYCITSLLRGDKNYKFTKLLFKKFCGITCIKGKFSLTSTEKKWIFISIKDFFSKCDQIRRKQRIWSYLLKKSLMENIVFCAVLILIL